MAPADRRSKNAGQAALELCVFLVVAIMAVLAMKLVMKGALLGRFRSTANAFGHGLQYEPQCGRMGGPETAVWVCEDGKLAADGTCAVFKALPESC